MIRFLFTATLVLMTGSALAQGARENDACARDVSRFCRVHMNDGNSVVLACLKEHRARLSKACEKVLADHGQ
jgi:Cysteine rich repeat